MQSCFALGVGLEVGGPVSQLSQVVAAVGTEELLAGKALQVDAFHYSRVSTGAFRALRGVVLVLFFLHCLCGLYEEGAAPGGEVTGNEVKKRETEPAESGSTSACHVVAASHFLYFLSAFWTQLHVLLVKRHHGQADKSRATSSVNAFLVTAFC